jgi:Spy/CpxP family protein refolding chaperone
MSDHQDNSGQEPARKRRNRLTAIVVATAVVVGGAFGVHAIAQTNAYEHLRTEAGLGGGWHHRDRKPLAEMSDAEVAERVTRMVRHLGIEIDATPEQEARIIGIATGVATDLRPLRQRARTTAMELQQLLTAETVDRVALENLRAARLAEADEISKTLVGAVADVAEVLTPEQRETVQAMIREARERRGGRRHGGWGPGRF